MEVFPASRAALDQESCAVSERFVVDREQALGADAAQAFRPQTGRGDDRRGALRGARGAPRQIFLPTCCLNQECYSSIIVALARWGGVRGGAAPPRPCV